MAEWFKRGTVNTFYRGSNPLKAYTKIFNYKKVLNNTILEYELQMYKL